MKHKKIWDDFCLRQRIVEQAVPLFETDDEQMVQTHEIGRTNKRKVLSRSGGMESLVIEQTELLISDLDNEEQVYDGLIYMMFLIEEGDVKPLYIGKTESRGRKNKLSANISKLRTDKGKFARWGDNYQYHIGDLSAASIPGHADKYCADKYRDWAKSLFASYPNDNPKLKRPVYYWCKAWKKGDEGIWQDFGKTRLTFLEYLMIGVASAAFPELLLNREGQSRS